MRHKCKCKRMRYSHVCSQSKKGKVRMAPAFHIFPGWLRFFYKAMFIREASANTSAHKSGEKILDNFPFLTLTLRSVSLHVIPCICAYICASLSLLWTKLFLSPCFSSLHGYQSWWVLSAWQVLYMIYFDTQIMNHGWHKSLPLVIRLNLPNLNHLCSFLVCNLCGVFIP